MEHQFALYLANVLKRLGPSAREAAKLRAELLNSIPTSTLEINLIVQLLEGGMLPDIAALVSKKDSQKAKELVKQLMEQFGTAPELAHWTVRVWIEAFRLGAFNSEVENANALVSAKGKLKSQKYIDALQELSASLEIMPASETYMLRGIAVVGLLQLVPSINYLLRIIHIHPRFISQVSSGFENPSFSFSRAIEVYEHITRLYPSTHAHTFQAACAFFGDDISHTVSTLVQVARRYRSEANYYSRKLLLFLEASADQAHLDFSRFHATEPQNAQAYFYHGVLLYLREELGIATTGLSLNNIVQFDRSERGKQRRDPERTARKQSIDYFTEALRLNPSLYEALYYRARSHYFYGKYEMAVADLDKLLMLEPNHVEAHILRASIRRDRLKYDTKVVEEELTTAIRINPFSAIGYAERGRSYWRSDRFTEAIMDLQQAIKLDPMGVLKNEPSFNSTLYYHWLANCYVDNGKDEKAIEVLNHAISLDQDDDNAYSSRGECYHRLGELELALADYRMAKALNDDDNPSSAFVYLALGDCYYDLGRKPEALWSYEKFIELRSLEDEDPLRFAPEISRAHIAEIFRYFDK